MRVKNNKALRRSARRHASVSRLATIPPAAPFLRHPGFRIGAANTVAAAVAGILYGASGTAWAQQAQAQAQEAAAATAPNTSSLEEVVVTANAEQGVRKLDASYNIVSANLSEVKMANPISSADILKLSPGIWPESSGGQTGANVEVAGFPSGGDAPFFTQMIQGLPMYGMPNLSFMDSTSFWRLDDTMERLEIVQGGPSVVFGPGQPGATGNIILRTGSSVPTGEIGVTYGNEGMWRTDAFYGFPVTDGWYGSVGGFYRVSDGVRPPSFPSDQGGQFTATLKHDLQDGSLMFWGRVLDDKNQFIVPVPLVQNSSGTSFSAFPSFCPLFCSFGSHNIQNVTIPNAEGGFQSADLSNGRGGDLYFFGINYDERFGDWHLLNNFMINGGGLDTNALFSGPNPRPLSYYLYGCNVPQAPGYCSSGVPVDTNNLTFTVNPHAPPSQTIIAYSANISAPTKTVAKNGQVTITYPTSMLNISAQYAGTGLPVSPDQSVVQQGWWYIQKSLSNAVDEFRATKTLFPGNTLTAGVYLAKYSMNDNWSLGNQMLMATEPNTTAITLNYLQSAALWNISSSQGFVSFNGNTNELDHGNAFNIAPYLSDSWRLGSWLLDAGVRLEHIDAKVRSCGGSNSAANAANTDLVQMGSQYDLWNNDVPFCNGIWNYEHYIRTMPSYSIGVNYEFSNHMSAYARWNTGVHFNDFDNGIKYASTATPPGFLPLQTVENYEIGWKFQNPWLYVDLSGYRRTFTGLSYQEATLTGSPLGIYSTFGSESTGADLTLTLTPLTGLNVRIITDYLDGHYQNQVGNSCFTNIFGAQQCVSVDGQPLQRQPRWRFDLWPSYTVPFAQFDMTAWINYEYVGQRYEDQFGLQPLGTYSMLGAGLVFDYGNHWQLRIQGTNLTNEIGLTEGNARTAGKAAGIGNVIMARPIEGREYNFGVFYKF
jgi:outer membrane receptor for Fe3+-dicitrate